MKQDERGKRRRGGKLGPTRCNGTTTTTPKIAQRTAHSGGARPAPLLKKTSRDGMETSTRQGLAWRKRRLMDKQGIQSSRKESRARVCFTSPASAGASPGPELGSWPVGWLVRGRPTFPFFPAEPNLAAIERAPTHRQPYFTVLAAHDALLLCICMLC